MGLACMRSGSEILKSVLSFRPRVSLVTCSRQMQLRDTSSKEPLIISHLLPNSLAILPSFDTGGLLLTYE